MLDREKLNSVFVGTHCLLTPVGAKKSNSWRLQRHVFSRGGCTIGSVWGRCCCCFELNKGPTAPSGCITCGPHLVLLPNRNFECQKKDTFTFHCCKYKRKRTLSTSLSQPRCAEAQVIVDNGNWCEHRHHTAVTGTAEQTVPAVSSVSQTTVPAILRYDSTCIRHTCTDIRHDERVKPKLVWNRACTTGHPRVSVRAHKPFKNLPHWFCHSITKMLVFTITTIYSCYTVQKHDYR